MPDSDIKQKRTIASVLQGLIRAIWGEPGRRTKEPIRRGPDAEQRGGRALPWATKADGSRNYDSQPLDNPPLHLLRRGGHDLQRIYAEVIRVSGLRENAYKDYEDMILDPTIAGGVEMMVDDACQYNREKKATAWVNTDDPAIKKAADELWEIGQIEERLWDWTFGGVLYGDWMVKPEAQVGKGIVSIMDDWHPADVQRIDVNGQLLGWRTPRAQTETAQSGGVTDDKDFHEAWEFVHFRIQASQRRRREIERQRMMPSIRFEKDDYRMTTKYGVSVLESVRRIYKQLQMVEQSLIIARMTRALKKYIYKVRVGAAADVKSATETVLAMRDLLTQQTGLRIGERFEQQYSPLAGSEDVFLPVFGERGDVDVQELGGDVDVHSIVDVDHLRKKLFGGLHIPAAYLGFESDLPGSLGESALLRLDINYARTIKRIQRMDILGLTRLLQIHLAYKKLNPDPSRFAVEMDVVSTAEEEERKSTLTSSISVARDLTGLNQDLGIKPNAKKFAKLMYGDVLQLRGEFLELIDEAEEVETTEMVGGPGGMPPGGPGMEGLPPMPGEPGAEPEQPGEGPLESPPPAEEQPAEVGPLPAPPARAESTIPDRAQPILAEAAKRQAIESVTRAVRSTSEIRDERTWPKIDESADDLIEHPMADKLVESAGHEDDGSEVTYADVFRMATDWEIQEAAAEREMQDDAWQRLVRESNHIAHLVEHGGRAAQVEHN